MANKAKTDNNAAVEAVDNALSIEFADQNDLDVSDLDLDEIEAQLEDAASELRDEVQREIEENGEDAEGAERVRLSASDIEAGPPETPPIPANDAYESELSNLIYAMQQKPRSNILKITALISVLWLGACAYYAYTTVFSTPNVTFEIADLARNTTLLTILAIALIPMLPLWAFASMTKRAFEMRHAASSMMAAAVKLLQPEKISSDSIATVGHAIRREVAAIGDGMNQAIARASELEFMVQKEVMSLERSYGDSEMRLRRLVDEISSERDEIITHADKLRGVINASSTSLASELEMATGKIEDSISSSAENLRTAMDNESLAVTTRFSEAGDGLIAILSDTSQTVNNTLSENTALFEKTMAERTASMKDVISTTGNTIASLLETRSAQINTATSEVEKRLDAGHRAFEITFDRKSEDLNALLAQSGQTVSDLVGQQSDAFARKAAELARTVDESRQTFENSMNTKVGEIGTSIASAGNTINTLLEASAKNLSDQSNNIIAEIGIGQAAFTAEMDGKTSEISQMMQKSAEKMTATLETGADELEKTGDRIVAQTADNLSVRASEFNSELGSIVSQLQNSIDEKLAGVESGIREQGDSLVNTLGMRTEALDKVLQERTGAIGSTIADRLSGFGHSLTGQVDDAIAKLQDQVDQLEQNTKAVEEVISTRTEKAESTLKSQTIAFAQAAEEAISKNRESSEIISAELTGITTALENHLQSGSEEIANTFDTRQTQLLAELEAKNQGLSEKLEDLLSALAGKFDSRGEELTATLDEKTERLDQLAAAKMSEIETRFSGTTNTLEEAIASSTDALSDVLQERTTNLASKLNQGAHRIASTLEEKTSEATSRMQSSVSQLDDALKQNNVTIEQQFAAGGKVLEERLESGKNDLLGAISKTISEAGNTIDEKADKISTLLEDRANLINSNLGKELVATQRSLEEKTSDFNKMMADRAEELSTLLNTRSSQLTGDFDERTERLNTLLSERAAELASIIENDAKPIIGSLDSTSAAVSDRLSGLSKMVTEETNILFGNLGQSSELLGKLIDEASTNLTLMQTTLDKQTTKFAETTNMTKANLDKTGAIAAELGADLQERTSSFLENLSRMAQRFEAQGIALQDSTKLIDAAQTTLEATLDSKQEALHELSSSLLSRSDEISTNISRFGQMITTMVDELGEKSRGIGSNVAAEVSKAINETTGRFSESVDEMRSAANRIRNELEHTREQMRRGIMELPDETEKSATAMRRVVNDQIAALRDLSELVEKSGRAIDLAPAKQSASAQTPSNRGATPASYTQSSAPVARQQAEDPSLEDFRDTLRLRRGQSFAQSPKEASPERQYASQNAGPENGGWVSDLLRRASRDEQPHRDTRSPNQVVDSLNSLSLDIASAIDHETSVDLWDRYQRGERNVFTRRLYTMQGQQTFDEISRKYYRDRDFRSAVDRYIEDFERLLTDVAQTGQGDRATQDYLTSDQGKVYTMLAHASGRFGND